MLGYVIRLGIAFVRLPNLVRDQREFGSYVLSQNEQIADFINQVSARVSEYRQEVSRLQETLSKQIESVSEQLKTLAGKQQEFERMAGTRFDELSQTTEAVHGLTAQAERNPRTN